MAGQVQLSRGFTLIEMLLVLVLAAILGGYFALSAQRVDVVTLPAQARRLAADLAHARALAMQWGLPLRLVAGQGSYALRCALASVQPPCDQDPVIDPVSGRPFQVVLEPSVVLSAGQGVELILDSLGRPISVDGSPLGLPPVFSYTLTASGASATVTVDAISGRISP